MKPSLSPHLQKSFVAQVLGQHGGRRGLQCDRLLWRGALDVFGRSDSKDIPQKRLLVLNFVNYFVSINTLMNISESLTYIYIYYILYTNYMYWHLSQRSIDTSCHFSMWQVQIFSTQSAFLALKPGSGQCWGNAAEGGDCSSVPLVASDQRFYWYSTDIVDSPLMIRYIDNTLIIYTSDLCMMIYTDNAWWYIDIICSPYF